MGVPRDWIDSDRSRSWIEGDRFRERSSRRSFDHESGINRPWNEVVSIENRNIRELERERDREMDLNRQRRCERDREIEKQKERQLELKKEKERAREKTENYKELEKLRMKLCQLKIGTSGN